jgi:hypothetical protein
MYKPLMMLHDLVKQFYSFGLSNALVFNGKRLFGSLLCFLLHVKREEAPNMIKPSG